MTADFDQFVDLTDVSPQERARLLRVHEMLVMAGPPPDLPVALSSPPTDVGAAVVELSHARRRRVGAAVAVAAAVAAACFGGGYVLATQTHGSTVHVFREVQLQGQQNSEAALRVDAADASGNWPMQFTVSGLKPLPNSERYYLMVLQNGKPVASCGTFEVNGKGSTTLTFSVAYRITKSTRWVVTEMAPGFKFPGHVVMTTT